MTDLDTILSQLMQELQDFSMWFREYALWVILGLAAVLVLFAWLPAIWERHKDNQQAYHPACSESAFAPLGIGFTPSSTVRRKANRRNKDDRKMTGLRAVHLFLTGRDY